MIIAEKTNHLFSRKPGHLRAQAGGGGHLGGRLRLRRLDQPGAHLDQPFLQHFTTLVDQIQIDHCAALGAALTPDNEGAVERSRQLGKNVARALELPFEEWKYWARRRGLLSGVPLQRHLHREGLPARSCAPPARCTAPYRSRDGKFSVAWNPDDVTRTALLHAQGDRTIWSGSCGTSSRKNRRRSLCRRSKRRSSSTTPTAR